MTPVASQLASILTDKEGSGANFGDDFSWLLSPFLPFVRSDKDRVAGPQGREGARAVMAVTQIGEYKNLMDVFKRTVANEGWLALYRGFVPTILGVIPYAGTSFFT